MQPHRNLRCKSCDTSDKIMHKLKPKLIWESDFQLLRFMGFPFSIFHPQQLTPMAAKTFTTVYGQLASLNEGAGWASSVGKGHQTWTGKKGVDGSCCKLNKLTTFMKL